MRILFKFLGLVLFCVTPIVAGASLEIVNQGNIRELAQKIVDRATPAQMSQIQEKIHAVLQDGVKTGRMTKEELRQNRLLLRLLGKLTKEKTQGVVHQIKAAPLRIAGIAGLVFSMGYGAGSLAVYVDEKVSDGRGLELISRQIFDGEIRSSIDKIDQHVSGGRLIETVSTGIERSAQVIQRISSTSSATH